MKIPHSLKNRWKRYRNNKHSYCRSARWRDRSLDKHFIKEPQSIDYVCKSTDLFDCAEEKVVSLLQRRPEIDDLDRYIDKLSKYFDHTKEPLDGLVSLYVQSPRSVLAQLQMDTYAHGYRNKKQRLYELIDFNDTLVKTILRMDDKHRDEFSLRAKQAIDRICKRVGAPEFSEEQWTAIIRGLTREVAVYSAAISAGFNAWLTDRAHDALGIDIQIQDPEDGRYVNIDVKTPSSYRHRMEQLVKEGRLSERDLMLGDERSYIIEMNGHGKDRVQVIVLCILPDLFGDLTDWRFVNAEPMRQKINRLIRDHGIHDGKYGVFME